MSEWLKTSAYVIAAVVMIGLAFGAEWLAQPVVPKEFEQVGTEFYPEFDNPLAAQSLEVTTYEPDTSVIHEFQVNWGDEGWTISPYGYPADAEDQLEKTAASVVGITREGLASRRESDHERFGVVDPHSTDSDQLTGRGERITLKDENGQVLLDLIIGKPAEGREGYYYVRKPKTDDVYIARIDVDLSTRFADWINSDLLGIDSGDLQRIHIFDYSVNQEQSTAAMRSESILFKKKDFGPWSLKGLDDPTKQVNSAAVGDLASVLADLKIIGVRPKPKGLNPDLTFDPKYISNQLSLLALQQRLIDKGFFLTKGSQGSVRLIGQEGQLIATTSEGIAYDLYFGEQFSGSLYDIEFGASAKGSRPTKLKPEEESKENDSASDDQATDAAKDSDGSDKAADAEAPDEDSGNKNAPLTGRYVFVAARFVPESLEKPEPPAPLAKEATEPEKKATEQAQADYEKSLAEYKTNVDETKQKVKKLNERFGEWYYVISTENFEDLRLSREALVEPKVKEKEKQPAEAAPGETTAKTAEPVAAPRPPTK